MATLTTQKAGPGVLGIVLPNVFMAEVLVDFSTFTAAQNDIIELFDTEHDDIVLGMSWEIDTICTTGLTISVGKAAGTELSTAFDPVVVAGTAGVGTNTTFVRFDDDTIDCKVLGVGPTSGKVRFKFLIWRAVTAGAVSKT